MSATRILSRNYVLILIAFLAISMTASAKRARHKKVDPPPFVMVGPASNWADRQMSKIGCLTDTIRILREQGKTTFKYVDSIEVLRKIHGDSAKIFVAKYLDRELERANLKNAIYEKIFTYYIRDTIENLRKRFVDKGLDVKYTDLAIFLEINDEILFESGSFNLKSSDNIVVEAIAHMLQGCPEVDFIVEGNTDNRPYSSVNLLDNWDLSTKRATTITRILQYKYSINPSRIYAAGRGEYNPINPQNIAGQNDESEQRLNRRTRIIILPNIKDLRYLNLLEEK